jgi:branched-chain amino acid transport system permease protein
VDTRRRLKLELRVAAFLLGIIALIPMVVSNDYWLGVLIVSMYFAMVATGWNILAGYTGQFSFAPATFGMLGAYVTGLAGFHFGLPAFAGIPAAVVVSAMIGFLLGRIVLRLHGPYLALTTLAFAEVVRAAISNSMTITRGDLGLNVEAIPVSRVGYYYFFLGALLLVVSMTFALLRSRAGLFLQAIRDDEIAASSRGVNVVTWKVVAFTLSAAIGGLAGALYAHFAQLISPELGLLSQSGMIVSMVVIGGMGSLVGPLAGAFLVYYLSELLRDAGGYQHIVFALLVIIFARFFREGLWGFTRALTPVTVMPSETAAAVNSKSDGDRLISTARVAPPDVSTSSPILGVETLSKSFGGLQAVKSVSFDVAEGEIVGLIGPNGSGKTTLLNILSGHYRADTGIVRLDGQAVQNARTNELAGKGLLRMFQLTRIFRRMSAFDNLMVAGRALGLTESEAQRRANALLQDLGLTGVAHLDAGRLSGGQAKLVEFGCCFIVPPRVVLLDEPFAAIHPTIKDVMAKFILKRNALGQTFVIVSHDMPIIAELCTTAVCMNAGEVIAAGKTRDVLSNPLVIESYLGEEHDRATHS